MEFLDIILVVVFIIAAIIAGLYFLSNWATKKSTEQQAFIQQNKVTQTIYVIDKKKDKIENAHMPKSVIEQFPKYLKFKKMPLVKAKIGPQIMTLLCDGKIYKELPLKKQIKVELAGLYIIAIKGNKPVVEKTKQSFMDKLKAKLPKKTETK